ncbi:ABC transporter permease [Frateuria sp.]|uniref:ABC transporter permease n=1 Tax=Frateuria sp. TaxID=2211372 RepID=UPI003F7FD295
MSIGFAEVWRTWRASLRRPGFLLLASGVLALGVGSSVAVFSLIDRVLLRPLPYHQPSHLVAVGPLEETGVSGISPQQYQQLQGIEGVRDMALYMPGAPSVNISGHGEAVLASSLQMDRHLLPTLGVRPLLGRNFTAQEDAPHGPAVAIVSYGLWQRRFGGKAAVIGTSLHIEGQPHTIVGVLPTDFDVEGDVVLPLAMPANSRSDGTNYEAVARLQSPAQQQRVAAQVDARLRAFYAQSTGAYGDWWRHRHFGVQDLHAFRHVGDGFQLALFMGCALVVLLIALVNLTNLMLLRALSRQHDGAVRGALGASSWRLALPVLAEGLLVGVLGAVAGLGLAAAALALLRGFMPAGWQPDSLYPGTVAWLVAAAVGVLGALLSAVGSLRRHAITMDDLREDARSGLGRRGGRLGRSLVMAQVALATALLCACGLFAHTLIDAARVPLGYRTQGIVTFELAPIKALYPDAAAVSQLSQRLVGRLRQAPGVELASATTNLPGGPWRDQFNLGGLHPPGGEADNAQFHAVDENYFNLFTIRLREGRAFAATDVRGAEPVAMVNRSLADRWYGGHALGKLIQRGDGPGMVSARIVGVVDDTWQLGPLNPRSRQPILYRPLAQVSEDALRAFRSFEPMRFALAVRGDPGSYRQAMQQAVADVAPGQPMDNVRLMTQVVHSTTRDTRMQLWLTGLFAALALLLAAAGLYAVMAVAVAARAHEFGVRQALGAAPTRLAWLVLRGGVAQVAIGLGLGVALALVLGEALRMLLLALGLDRGMLDLPVLAIVGVVLLGIGALASLLPAVRAGRVPPMRALRGE